MGKKVTWTKEKERCLVRIRDEVQSSTQGGNPTVILKAIDSKWKEMFPGSLVSIGALKIKLSKLAKVQEAAVTSQPVSGLGNKIEDRKSTGDDKVQSPQNVQQAPEYHVQLEKPHHKHKKIEKCRTEPFKHKGKKDSMSRVMKNALIKNYMAVVKQFSNKKLSDKTILRPANCGFNNIPHRLFLSKV